MASIKLENILYLEGTVMRRLSQLWGDAQIRNKMIYMIVLVLAIVVCVGTAAITIYTEKVSQTLSESILRFHVVANSDTTEDQLLKQQVKDEIIAYMEPLLKDAKDVEESKVFIQTHTNEIADVAKNVVNKWGRDYDVRVFLDKANFPTKSYGDVVLPAGEYEACRVIIGEGKGQNWWCIMFPPLCYVDAATGVVPIEGKEELQEQLTPEQYDLICKEDKPYEIRFKIVDTVNSLLHKKNYKEAEVH